MEFINADTVLKQNTEAKCGGPLQIYGFMIEKIKSWFEGEVLKVSNEGLW